MDATEDMRREILIQAGMPPDVAEYSLRSCRTIPDAKAVAARFEKFPKQFLDAFPGRRQPEPTVAVQPANLPVDPPTTTAEIRHMADYPAPTVQTTTSEDAAIAVLTPAADEVDTVNPKLVTLSSVKPEAIRWLWRGYLARAMLTLVDGDPGLGKSTVVIDLAARVTTGRPMPFETARSKPADVIIMSAEDHIAATIRPRCDAAGADVDRIHVVVAMPKANDPDAPPMLCADDIARLEIAIVRHEAAVVLIDPFMAYLGGDVDSQKDQDVRRVLRLLAAVAERTGATIIIIRHLRKSGGPALYRGGGSIGIIGAARLALLVAKDPDDENGRVIAVSKSNLAAVPPAVRWCLVDAGGVAKVEWTGTCDVTADELAAVAENVVDADPIDAAVEAFTSLLADGPRPSKEVEADVKAMSGCSPRTVDRARQKLGLVAERVGKGWSLRLKDAMSASAKGCGVLESGDAAKSVTPSKKSRRNQERHGQGRHEESEDVASLKTTATEDGVL